MPEIYGEPQRAAPEKSAYRREIIEKVAALVTVAFGLVAALAWNTAIQQAFIQYFGEATGLVPMLIYAVLVTAIAVGATIWIGRVAGKMGVQGDKGKPI